jgi:hypothetical protein
MTLADSPRPDPGAPTTLKVQQLEHLAAGVWRTAGIPLRETALDPPVSAAAKFESLDIPHEKRPRAYTPGSGTAPWC